MIKLKTILNLDLPKLSGRDWDSRLLTALKEKENIEFKECREERELLQKLWNIKVPLKKKHGNWLKIFLTIKRKKGMSYYKIEEIFKYYPRQGYGTEQRSGDVERRPLVVIRSNGDGN